MKNYLNYDDICLVPQYSEVRSRGEVDISSELGGLKVRIPILSSNMDTITGPELAIAMWNGGGLGCLHRFLPIEENVKQFLQVKASECECFVSVGVSRDSLERAEHLYNAGARHFIVDIAHGHSVMMKEMLNCMKMNLPNIFVIAGNIGTPQAVKDLQHWGADAIKYGIAGGKVCTTKHVTGVETPTFSGLLECSTVAKLPIIADGGIRQIGDISKGLIAGSSFSMSGFLFAGCLETPPVLTYRNAVTNFDAIKFVCSQNDLNYIIAQKRVSEAREGLIYRGSASSGAMAKILGEKEYAPTPEGTTVNVELKGSVEEILKAIAGGIQSSCSYSNAKNLKEFHAKAQWVIK